MDLRITEYINKNENWAQELNLLRSVLLEVGLQEDIKWGIPAYIHKGKNIMGMSAFKNYVGIWFHQGVFLKDDQKVLMNAQEGKTKAMRQWRFNSIKEINAGLVKEYVLEAMKNSEEGKVVKVERNSKPLIIPEELEAVFTKDSKVKLKFEEFTLSKKREFTEHISEAKREATKLKRIEKIIPLILNGVGLHDKYRK
ncbi:YdeI/OmpD-associated family protein [Tenacibaculum xiamenense]|uniref:YdeI/OmpD-associated family protein n=1 Tax=Tenacibaculum xiamenense TaxID=1261553 RepID=UPI003894AFA9